MPIWDVFETDDTLDDIPDKEPLDLDPCCACGRTQGVSNIILLNRLCPTPGFGWMCYQCGLPANGAAAVLCNDCLESKAEIKFVCTCRPADPSRTPIEELPPGEFKHRMELHPEA